MIRPVIGQVLAHYRILEQIGEGGMGVVYRALDTHLDRIVAIKVLPPHRTSDAERKLRFVQEAKSASALRHPNIITIYDISEDNGVSFIVMEWVPGKPLSQLIPPKGLGLTQALKYAVQITDALAAAHAKGLVHRDLKPANVMADESGSITVLDFGLAKLTEASAAEAADAHTRTVERVTEEGAIVGTVSYMSPEQAEGKAVDARSDVFSFGCVLYEMLTGQRAFQGDSPISTLSAVLRSEPTPIRELASDVPPEVERLLKRCLRKNPDRRFQHMSDLKVALEESRDESDSGTLSLPSTVAPSRSRARLWLAVVVLAMGTGVTWWALGGGRMPTDTRPKTAPLTSYEGFEAQPSFSPDGNQVVFVWNDDIFVRLIGAGEPVALTNTPQRETSPVWSSDGRWIAFVRQVGENREAVLLIPALGGRERKLKEISPPPSTFPFPGVSCVTGFCGSQIRWSTDGNWIAYSDFDASTQAASLQLLSVDSGETRRLTKPVPSEFDVPGGFSPEGRRLVFMRARGTIFASDIYILPLDAALNPSGEPVRLTLDGKQNYLPAWTSDGQHIVFSSARSGPEALWKITAAAAGAPVALEFANRRATQPAIAGERLAYVMMTSDVNIWRLPITGQSAPARLIGSTRVDANAQYSPDGTKIAFCSGRSGHMEVWIADGDGSRPVQLTFLAEGDACTPRWSPDGRQVAFDSNVTGQIHVYVISADGGRPRQLTDTPAQNALPSWSRDGTWVYFESLRTGRPEIWKVPAIGGPAVQVTRNGGHLAFESADGHTLYYTKAEHAEIWQMPVGGGAESKIVDPILLRNFFPVPRGIYFMRPEERGASVQFFEFATRRVRKIGSTTLPASNGLSVFPDERWVIYSQWDQLGSDIVLVENFR
jgi:eukaryotic-like serine/threonine-protein kinase